MATKIFITGSTGYIGGSVLATIADNHPEYDITALLRNVPENFAARYPNVHIVHGDYDSGEIIAEAASQANVVIHNGNSDHEASIKALIAGLLRHHGGEPSFLIHLSGTGILSDWKEGEYLGRVNPKIWSDVGDIDAITSRPDRELHRNVDKIIQAAAAEHGATLKTAIMCPPDIYGPGRGPGKTKSAYFPMFVREIKEVGAPFYVGEGTNARSWVHIDDLMTLYLKLVEAAAAGGKGADWGKEGYYFASVQEASQIEVAKATGKILKAHGVIADAEPKAVSLEQISVMMGRIGIPGIGTYMFGSNARTRAERAPKLFGYRQSAPSIWDSMEADLLACID